MRWCTRHRRARRRAPVETHVQGEWWKTLELSAGERGRLYFADESTAEGFARFLIDQGAVAVAIEHWRDGRRAGLSVLNPSGRV